MSKDFYNFLDYSFTCGRCGKKMKAWRALFHWHILPANPKDNDK